MSKQYELRKNSDNCQTTHLYNLNNTRVYLYCSINTGGNA